MLVGGIALLAFLLGYQEGKTRPFAGVTLSCGNDVLSALKIPANELASGRGGVPQVAGITTSTDGSVNERSPASAQGKFVGSKNGTKFYPPDCPSVKRINPENYIWFDSEQDALLQGYTRAANC